MATNPNTYRARQMMKADRDWPARASQRSRSEEQFLRAVNEAKGRGRRIYRLPTKQDAIDRVMQHYAKMSKAAKANVGPATNYQILVASKPKPKTKAKAKPAPARSPESRQNTDRNLYEARDNVERSRGWKGQ